MNLGSLHLYEMLGKIHVVGCARTVATLRKRTAMTLARIQHGKRKIMVQVITSIGQKVFIISLISTR